MQFRGEKEEKKKRFPLPTIERELYETTSNMWTSAGYLTLVGIREKFN